MIYIIYIYMILILVRRAYNMYYAYIIAYIRLYYYYNTRNSPVHCNARARILLLNLGAKEKRESKDCIKCLHRKGERERERDKERIWVVGSLILTILPYSCHKIKRRGYEHCSLLLSVIRGASQERLLLTKWSY